MSQKFTIFQIDQNAGNWINTFLTSNQYPVTNTIQDKITTLYLLQHHNLLSPLSLDDIFKVSPEFIQGMVLANKYNDQGDRINRLSALIILYNISATNPNDNIYISNPRFNEVFISDPTQVRSLLAPSTTSFNPIMSITPITPITTTVNPITSVAPITTTVRPVAPITTTVKPITPVAPITTTVKPITPIAPVAPITTTVRPITSVAPITTTVRPTTPVAPITTTVRPITSVAPITTTVRPITSVAPVTTTVRPITPVAPITTTVRPITSVAPVTTTVRPITSVAPVTTTVRPITSVAPVTTTVKPITSVSLVNPIIVEGNYKYRICQLCQAHIYNEEGICGLCDEEELIPDEIFEQHQIENYIDTDPNYVDFEDYYDGEEDEYFNY